MNSLDAQRLMIRSYPGGLDAVALRLGKAASTLEKELRGAQGFKFGESDANAVAAMCCEVGSPHALAWLNVVATNCGIDLPAMPARAEQPGDLMLLLSSSVRETSDVTLAVIAAMSDGSVSPIDHRNIQREVAEAMDALQKLMRSVDAAAVIAAERAQRLGGR